MRCPKANELKPFVKNGKEQHKKETLKNTIRSIKFSASQGKTEREFLMNNEEDAQYCADFLQQKGYTITIRHDALGWPLLCVSWGE